MTPAPMTRFPFTKYGLAVDPVGEYVRLDIGDRIMLGEVRSTYRDDVRGVTHATVRHFNGEPWPIDPAISALLWIKQDGGQ